MTTISDQAILISTIGFVLVSFAGLFSAYAGIRLFLKRDQPHTTRHAKTRPSRATRRSRFSLTEEAVRTISSYRLAGALLLLCGLICTAVGLLQVLYAPFYTSSETTVVLVAAFSFVMLGIELLTNSVSSLLHHLVALMHNDKRHNRAMRDLNHDLKTLHQMDLDLLQSHERMVSKGRQALWSAVSKLLLRQKD